MNDEFIGTSFHYTVHNLRIYFKGLIPDNEYLMRFKIGQICLAALVN